MKVPTRELLAVIHSFPNIIKPFNDTESSDKLQAALSLITGLYPFDAAYSAEDILDYDSKWQRQVDESLGRKSDSLDTFNLACEPARISQALRAILKVAFSDLASEPIPDDSFWELSEGRKEEDFPKKLKTLDEWAASMEKLYGKELELPEISKELLLKNLLKARRGGSQNRGE